MLVVTNTGMAPDGEKRGPHTEVVEPQGGLKRCRRKLSKKRKLERGYGGRGGGGWGKGAEREYSSAPM